MSRKNAKLHEMILYVLDKQPMDRVKLGNLLFFADKNAYVLLGKSLSGTKYWKRPWGAEPRNFGQILGALRRHRRIEPVTKTPDEEVPS